MSHSIHKELYKHMHSIQHKPDGTIVSPQGFLAAGVHAGFRWKHKDLGMLVSTKPAKVAAVYTMNRVQAAPLVVTKRHLAQNKKMQALIVNSGNANACTGEQGIIDAETTCAYVAEQLSIPMENVIVASTGVIGEQMPMEKLPPAIKKLHLTNESAGGMAFSESILTTDTCTKTTCYEAIIDGEKITVAGVAKGSGMIAPNMATMLAFLTTDAHVDQGALQRVLSEIIDETFNCITVDGDMSTNDMVCLFSNGKVTNELLDEHHPDWEIFKQVIRKICIDLAKDIAKDGEGATKLIEVQVNGAQQQQDARRLAKSVIGSSLVKTAVFGTDPNWGRIIAAIGASGILIHPEKIDIAIGSILLMEQGVPCVYTEEDVISEMDQEQVKITINVHMGEAEGRAWGCDLTYDYVKINASYRT